MVVNPITWFFVCMPLQLYSLSCHVLHILKKNPLIADPSCWCLVQSGMFPCSNVWFPCMLVWGLQYAPHEVGFLLFEGLLWLMLIFFKRKCSKFIVMDNSICIYGICQYREVVFHLLLSFFGYFNFVFESWGITVLLVSITDSQSLSIFLLSYCCC